MWMSDYYFPISGAEWTELAEGIVCQYSGLFIWGEWKKDNLFY